MNVHVSFRYESYLRSVSVTLEGLAKMNLLLLLGETK